MPIGIQRLNAKKSQPNANIVFIKPLKGQDEAISLDFLERIAAQCFPVMREHHIHVMSLEEFPANREFVGRNFNAGEVIQLVLKSPSGGRWLPFNYVQMVMMHELAHCKQMNHSRAFWAIRNQYATQMQTLWVKGYQGDGIWGRGAKLNTGEWERNAIPADEVPPKHLCGGIYRSRKGKRKPKLALSHKDKKEKRILKKFGKNGVTLGADDEAKVKLEKGKRIQSKPRVAGSIRGRELRAAAALARFEGAKEEGFGKQVKETDSEGGSDYESDYESVDLDSQDAIDIDGSRLVDKNGKGMVKICEDATVQDLEAKTELDELQSMFTTVSVKADPGGPLGLDSLRTRQAKYSPKLKPDFSIKPDIDDGGCLQKVSDIRPAESDGDTSIRLHLRQGINFAQRLTSACTKTTDTAASDSTVTPDSNTATISCSRCTFDNLRTAATCAMCENELDP